MQVHYNLLVGDKPVKNTLVLHTVPVTTPLLPLKLDLMPAPPDIPCPTGVTGPLCNRAASLANLGKRFGQSAVGFVNAIESVCGRNAANPPEATRLRATGPSTKRATSSGWGPTCTSLGVTFKMVLNPGTPEAKTILNVPDYNFHYQKAYNLKTPVAVSPGDQVQVNCTYNPKLAAGAPHSAQGSRRTSSPGVTGHRTRCAWASCGPRPPFPTPATPSDRRPRRRLPTRSGVS